VTFAVSGRLELVSVLPLDRGEEFIFVDENPAADLFERPLEAVPFDYLTAAANSVFGIESKLPESWLANKVVLSRKRVECV
jgi:hypothetical protein